jgi:hypothetical protein
MKSEKGKRQQEITMDTKRLIDFRNIDLWNTLSKEREIKIQREKVNNYSAFSKDNKTTIYVPLDNEDPASFTHELLHVFLRTKDVYIGAGLQISIKDSKVLSKIFSDKLIEHIGNCLDHIKMYPEFVKLGYNPEEFLSDYSENKLTNDEIFNIKKHFIRPGFLKKLFTISRLLTYSLENILLRFLAQTKHLNTLINFQI